MNTPERIIKSGAIEAMKKTWIRQGASPDEMLTALQEMKLLTIQAVDQEIAKMVRDLQIVCKLFELCSITIEGTKALKEASAVVAKETSIKKKDSLSDDSFMMPVNYCKSSPITNNSESNSESNNEAAFFDKLITLLESETFYIKEGLNTSSSLFPLIDKEEEHQLDLVKRKCEDGSKGKMSKKLKLNIKPYSA